MSEILIVQIFIQLVFKLAATFIVLMALWIPTTAILRAINPSKFV